MTILNSVGCNHNFWGDLRRWTVWRLSFGKIFNNQCKNVKIYMITVLLGRVEKTDPRSADYPLTPAPRTTLRTTPRTTLQTTPTDYPKKSTKFLLRSTKIQKAYLFLALPTRSNSRHFLFLHFSTQSFHFAPFFTGRSPNRTLFPLFHNGRSVSAVEYLSL